MHQIAIEQQHKSFALVHRYLKRAQKRRAKYADKNAEDIRLTVGEPVFYRVHNKKNKLNLNWQPGWRIVQVTSPTTYLIHNQLTGCTTKANVVHLRRAPVDEWVAPKIGIPEGRALRKTNYVVPPDNDSDSNGSCCSSDSENVPLAKLVKRCRKERDDSEAEDDIPQMELAKRLRESDVQDESGSESVSSSSTHLYGLDGFKAPLSMHSGEEDNSGSLSENSDENMSVNEFCSIPLRQKRKQSKKQSNKKDNVKDILLALTRMLEASN